MPLYEIVLDSGDDEEVRLTDQRPTVGEILELHGASWKIVERLESTEEDVDRFRALPA
jgi:hypothetical protein